MSHFAIPSFIHDSLHSDALKCACIVIPLFLLKAIWKPKQISYNTETWNLWHNYSLCRLCISITHSFNYPFLSLTPFMLYFHVILHSRIRHWALTFVKPLAYFVYLPIAFIFKSIFLQFPLNFTITFSSISRETLTKGTIIYSLYCMLNSRLVHLFDFLFQLLRIIFFRYANKWKKERDTGKSK